MPVWIEVRNPCSETSSRYGPIGRLGNDEHAVGIGDDFALEPGVGLRRGHVGAGQHAAARILAPCR